MPFPVSFTSITKLILLENKRHAVLGKVSDAQQMRMTGYLPVRCLFNNPHQFFNVWQMRLAPLGSSITVLVLVVLLISMEVNHSDCMHTKPGGFSLGSLMSS